MKAVAAGANPMALKRGIDKAVELVTEEVKKLSKPVSGDMIAQVGTISANSDHTIGNIIAKAMKKVGKDGVITVEELKTMGTSWIPSRIGGRTRRAAMGEVDEHLQALADNAVGFFAANVGHKPHSAGGCSFRG